MAFSIDPAVSPVVRISRLLPARLRSGLQQACRDLAAVARSLRGEAPPPFALRRRARIPGDDGGAGSGTATSRPLAGRAVRVEAVVAETADAVTLLVVDPSGAPFTFQPGQFFTVCVTIDGEPLRRAYSASSAATTRDRLALTVKRVPGGRVSTHLTRHVRAGDRLDLLGPSGAFGVMPDAAARRHLVLLAGGSGITPMMSLCRTLLADEPQTRIDLVYGNRGTGDIIFAKALSDLEREHEPRFRLRHVLAEPPIDWPGGRGLLTCEIVTRELARLAPPSDAEYFVCGPEPMMQEVRGALARRNVAASRIHEERFTQPHLRPSSTATSDGIAHELTIATGSARLSLPVPPGQTLLEAAVGAGVALPYSCAMGGCAACKVRLVEGEVAMEEPSCLSAAERARGEILACVSRPLGAVTIAVNGAINGAVNGAVNGEVVS